MSDEERWPTEETGDLGEDEAPTVGDVRAREVVELPPQVGNYRILRKIGEGGMGAVYEAEQDRPRRRVALKAIRPESTTPEIIKRFEQELQVLGRLHHPGIAEIYDAGTVVSARGPQPYFAMEYIDGETLTTYSQTHDLTTRQRLALMAKICDAIQHAHQRGVVHRDLKPGNIMVVDTETSTDGNRPGSSTSIDADDVGQPKILDFGVARATGLDLQVTLQTDIGQIIGTVPYMSPEQVCADPQQVDTRSDVYALGVIAYELLAGHLPYEVWRKPIQEAARIISEEEPSRLRTVKRQFRGDVDTIVRKALEKDRERRYQSAEEMAADIRRFLAEQPILARPPSAAYQLKKFARRNRGLVAGIVVSILLLIAGTAVSTWQAVRASRGEKLAAREAEKAQAVSSFLQEMLAAPDPNVGGREVRVVDVLDRAEERLEQLSDQPAVEVALRRTLGRTLLGLGENDDAQRHFERALELVGDSSEEGSPETAEILGELAATLYYQGKFTEALALEREVLELKRRLLGPDHYEVMVSQLNLAVFLKEAGLPGEAMEIERDLLKLAEQVLGADHELTLTAMNNLALGLQKRGDLVEAEELFRRALEIRRRTVGESHAKNLALSLNLAFLFDQLGRHQEALDLHLSTLDTRMRVLGAEHKETLNSRNGAALALLHLGRAKEAAEVYEQLLPVGLKALGENHPTLLSWKAHYGTCLRSLGRFEEAEEQLLAACESLSTQIGDGALRTQDVIEDLVELYDHWGKADQAALYRDRLIDANRP